MPNILIADDHDLVRETIAAYLSQSPDFKVITVATLRDALTSLGGELPIDLAILDYNMPGMDGLSGLEAAVTQYPISKIALMSGVATPEVAKEAMSLGARGFFPKSLSAESMVNAIRFVLSGEQYFPFEFAKEQAETTNKADYRGLTPREMETLLQLCEGKSNKEIARELGLQEVTVKLHVKNILTKMKVKNRTQAALLAREDGI